MKLVALFGTLLLTLTSIQGFCVYNNLVGVTSSLHIKLPTTSANYFQKRIRSGRKECCHYTNRDCNESGEREASLRFYTYFELNGTSVDFERELRVTCDGGGAIEFEGSSLDDIFAVCTHVNGTYTTYLLPPPISATDISLFA